MVLIFLYIEEKSETDLIFFSRKLPSPFFLNKNIFMFDTLHNVCIRLVFFCLFIEEKSDTDRLVSFPQNTPVLLHYIFYILHKVCFRLIFIFLYIEEKSERYISLFLPKYQPLSFTTRIYLILYATQSLRQIGLHLPLYRIEIWHWSISFFPQKYQPHHKYTDVSRLLNISVVYMSEKEMKHETKLLPTSFFVFL